MNRRLAGAWVSIDDAAKLLDTSARAVQRMIQAGQLPAERLSAGKRPPYVIRRSEIKALPKRLKKLESRRELERPPAKCGTIAGHTRHRRHGEPACTSCRQARAAYDRERRMSPSELATLHARQEAEQILATLPREPEWLIAQRREDLLDDVRRLSRRQRRNRIMRDHEKRTA